MNIMSDEVLPTAPALGKCGSIHSNTEQKIMIKSWSIG